MRIEQISKQICTSEKEVDFYVPVKIEFKDNDNKDKELLYYRMFNSKASFVEISINSETGKIVNITLASVNDVEDIRNEHICLNIPKIVGNPLIDMKVFENEHIVTDNINFKIIRHKRRIYVLREDVKLSKQVVMDDVSLLLDEQSAIIGVVFERFTDDEWIELNESIDSSVSIALET